MVRASLPRRRVAEIVAAIVLASGGGTTIVANILVGREKSLVTLARVTLFVIVVRLVDSVHWLASSVERRPRVLVAFSRRRVRIAKAGRVGSILIGRGAI